MITDRRTARHWVAAALLFVVALCVAQSLLNWSTQPGTGTHALGPVVVAVPAGTSFVAGFAHIVRVGLGPDSEPDRRRPDQ